MMQAPKFVCRTGKRVGQVVEILGMVTNQAHPHFGDVRYRNVTSGQRRRQGLITSAELSKSWEQIT